MSGANVPTSSPGLPSWAAQGAADLLTELTAPPWRHQEDVSFCHWDIRHDNILIRAATASRSSLDWGMSRLGARWSDLLVFALEWADPPSSTRSWPPSGSPADEAGRHRLPRGYRLLPADGGHPCAAGVLPNMPAFRRQAGTACCRRTPSRKDSPLRRYDHLGVGSWHAYQIRSGSARTGPEGL